MVVKRIPENPGPSKPGIINRSAPQGKKEKQATCNISGLGRHPDARMQEKERGEEFFLRTGPQIEPKKEAITRVGVRHNQGGREKPCDCQRRNTVSKDKCVPSCHLGRGTDI